MKKHFQWFNFFVCLFFQLFLDIRIALHIPVCTHSQSPRYNWNRTVTVLFSIIWSSFIYTESLLGIFGRLSTLWMLDEHHEATALQLDFGGKTVLLLLLITERTTQPNHTFPYSQASEHFQISASSKLQISSTTFTLVHNSDGCALFRQQ